MDRRENKVILPVVNGNCDIINKMNYTKLYPIGTVVRANKLNLMIISLVRKYQGELYDYIGVIYPQGYSDEEHMVLFNQNDITAVYHIGYINDQIRDYLNDIKKEIEEH